MAFTTRIFRTIVIICRNRLVLLYGYHRFVIQFFSRFDADKSGFISFAEFAVAGPSARDVEEETAVLQPQWDALSEVFLSCDHSSWSVIFLCSSFVQALSSLRGLHGSEAPVSTESAPLGEGSAEAEAAAGRRRLSRRSK